MKKNLDEGVALIDNAGNEWIGSNSRLSIHTVIRRAANKFSDDPVANLAAYLKYCFGGLYPGEEDSGWLVTAKEAQKILEGK
jgi:hypothetical protein